MVFYCIVTFILGITIGISACLFIVGTSKSNNIYEYYNEGFLDGYNKKSEEIDALMEERNENRSNWTSPVED